MIKQSMRIEYGKYLKKIGSENSNIIVLEADLKDSTQSIQFSEAYPERFFDIGIAEQNMVGIAAGMAIKGKVPIVHSFACFISMRACEQVRTSVAYPNLNVKFIVSHGGISCGSAGTTHHSIEDIAIMRAIPNMTVIVPGDVAELKQAVKEAVNYKGPVYIRISANDTEDVYDESKHFEIGNSIELRTGNDATIIATGTMCHQGLVASDKLRELYGINTRVLQMASIKPFDKNAVIKAAQETGYIVTVEEHNIIGGLGSAVCEVVAENCPVKVKRLGINDRYSDVGTAEFLMKEENLTVENIIQTIRNLRVKEQIICSAS